MPNHIINILKFKNLTQTQVWDIVNRITNINPDDPLGTGTTIDFDKIIPEPRTKEECPEDCLITPDSHVSIDDERPWFDWYAWRTKYWDTKWNAYSAYTKINKSSVQFVFNTAWSAPAAIYSQLVKMFPDVIMEVEWADEDYSSGNCGKAIYDPERTGVSDLWVIDRDEMPNLRRFARDLWTRYWTRYWKGEM